MENIGEYLKRHREKHGVSLEHIASITKISVGTLKKLEANDVKNLPPFPYVRGFLISIAKVLNIDPIDIINIYLNKPLPQTETAPIIPEAKPIDMKIEPKVEYKGVITQVAPIAPKKEILAAVEEVTKKITPNKELSRETTPSTEYKNSYEDPIQKAPESNSYLDKPMPKDDLADFMSAAFKPAPIKETFTPEPVSKVVKTPEPSKPQPIIAKPVQHEIKFPEPARPIFTPKQEIKEPKQEPARPTDLKEFRELKEQIKIATKEPITPKPTEQPQAPQNIKPKTHRRSHNNEWKVFALVGTSCLSILFILGILYYGSSTSTVISNEPVINTIETKQETTDPTKQQTQTTEPQKVEEAPKTVIDKSNGYSVLKIYAKGRSFIKLKIDDENVQAITFISGMTRSFRIYSNAELYAGDPNKLDVVFKDKKINLVAALKTKNSGIAEFKHTLNSKKQPAKATSSVDEELLSKPKLNGE